MRRSSFSAKGLRGSGFPPVKPVIVFVSGNTFRISGYNALYKYALSVTGGTATSPDSTGAFTTTAPANGTDVVCAITPSFGPAGPAATLTRRYRYMTADTRYNYPCGTFDTGGECTAATYVGTCGLGNCSTGCENLNYCCTKRNPTVTNTRYCEAGSAPALIAQSGFTDTGTDWYQIS